MKHDTYDQLIQEATEWTQMKMNKGKPPSRDKLCAFFDIPPSGADRILANVNKLPKVSQQPQTRIGKVDKNKADALTYMITQEYFNWEELSIPQLLSRILKPNLEEKYLPKTLLQVEDILWIVAEFLEPSEEECDVLIKEREQFASEWGIRVKDALTPDEQIRLTRTIFERKVLTQIIFSFLASLGPLGPIQTCLGINPFIFPGIILAVMCLSFTIYAFSHGVCSFDTWTFVFQKLLTSSTISIQPDLLHGLNRYLFLTNACSIASTTERKIVVEAKYGWRTLQYLAVSADSGLFYGKSLIGFGGSVLFLNRSWFVFLLNYLPRVGPHLGPI